LSHIAHAVALAIERTRFFRAEAQRREEAETLYQAATALTTHLNPEDVLELILEQWLGAASLRATPRAWNSIL